MGPLRGSGSVSEQELWLKYAPLHSTGAVKNVHNTSFGTSFAKKNQRANKKIKYFMDLNFKMTYSSSKMKGLPPLLFEGFIFFGPKVCLKKKLKCP